MDFNAIGVGAIIGAILTSSTNIYIAQRNRKRDEIKERFKNLYYPLYAVISKKEKYLGFLKTFSDKEFEKFAIEYYNFFLKLRDIYLDNKVYESIELMVAFNALILNHERESYNYRHVSSEEENIRQLALFELKHKVDKDGLSEIERNVEKIIEVVNSDIYKLK